MKDAYVFLPERGNTRAMVAVSALARAMKEMDKVAILRCVWTKGLKKVTIGVLTPNLSEKEHIVSFLCLLYFYNFICSHFSFSSSYLFISCFSDYAVQPDSFYFNVLPFAEDVREFQFPSFSNFPASRQPNGKQLKAAANLIKKLDLAPHGQQEVLLPDFTPNPVSEVRILSIHILLVYILISSCWKSISTRDKVNLEYICKPYHTNEFCGVELGLIHLLTIFSFIHS